MWQHRSVSKISSEQAAQISVWLGKAGFRVEAVEPGKPERWSRDECQVQLTYRGKHAQVQIRHRETNADWHDLDEVLDLRAEWPKAGIIPPIELATLPQLYAHKQLAFLRRAPGVWLYTRSKAWAYGIKVLLQMLVAIGAVVDIGMHVAHSVSAGTGSAPLAPPATTSIQVIAYALAVAAAIELAYTLFTPGPDEALDPLMLGLSSGLLLLITSTEESAVARYSGVLIGAVALALLFIVRRNLLDDE
jgi:hypothetical protein